MTATPYAQVTRSMGGLVDCRVGASDQSIKGQIDRHTPSRYTTAQQPIPPPFSLNHSTAHHTHTTPHYTTPHHSTATHTTAPHHHHAPPFLQRRTHLAHPDLRHPLILDRGLGGVQRLVGVKGWGWSEWGGCVWGGGGGGGRVSGVGRMCVRGWGWRDR